MALSWKLLVEQLLDTHPWVPLDRAANLAAWLPPVETKQRMQT